jgi:aminopeptidase N
MLLRTAIPPRSAVGQRPRRTLPIVLAAVGVALGGPGASLAGAAPKFTPGATSLGDSLFPTIGNGGYDVRHYDLDLDYVVARKRLDGTATIDAVATQALSRFSFDLTSWNRVRRVTVAGRRARFSVDAKRSKLVVTPPRGIPKGRRFRTVVDYGGTQRGLGKATVLTEGWIADPKRGAVALGQPVGSMGWYPSNNVPADKATYRIAVTVPRGFSALATGVLTARRTAGRGKDATTTFVWKETARTASYLVSVSVGRFTVNSLDPAKPKMTKPAKGSRNRPVPFYTAISSGLNPQGKASTVKHLGRSPKIVDFFSAYFGTRYPFTSLGGIATLQRFEFGLETQGKPTYSFNRGARAAGVSAGTVAHELAHQFFGNLVSPARWRDLWLSEGMAIFSEWLWQSTDTSLPFRTSPRDQYLDVYANANYPISWRVPPADPGSTKDLFDGAGIYRRAPATIAAIREILGDARFRMMMRRWLTEHAYGNATTEQFIALVKETDPARAARWAVFFQQWLYTSYPAATAPPPAPVPKPEINVDNFDSFVLPGR